MKSVHYRCLKPWLETKITKKKLGNVMSYYVASLECEICKASYPGNFGKTLDTVTIAETKYDLLDIEKPAQGPYLELETVAGDKAFSKVVHIARVTPEKAQLKLGRGREADVKLGDISVSRLHALITLTPKGFVLQDNGSKFGTLLLMPSEPQKIPVDSGLCLQIGKTTLKFSFKPNKVKVKKEVESENMEIAEVL
eukprot:TRINITY_DN6402_c0_g1_i12.p2 TRINITY_DN6402_c0_g1~~TRINITY_DN6402_c0_g1_i12.p2  ORF type:complete len:196 (+),score=42.53 TRINITY_DN6402_c0_g1_i12:782-1369(+)